MLDRFQRLAHRWFGNGARQSARRNPHLSKTLQKAHMRLRPEVYLATLTLAGTIAAGFQLLLIAALFALATFGPFTLETRTFVLLLPLPVVTFGAIRLVGLLWPDMRARSRARDIDNRLPYALNYVSTMAAAGASPDRLLQGLARQDLYGEVTKEAAWIVRDMDYLGCDLITALQAGIDRSPSTKWQDLLQGVVTVLTGGGDLTSYFRGKAEQFLYENRQEQRKFLDGLGVLAESFVVVVAAAPLFLMVILSVLGMFGGDPADTLVLGYMVILVMLPLSQAGFAFTINSMTPEA